MRLSRGSSQLRNRTCFFCISCIAVGSLPLETPGKPMVNKTHVQIQGEVQIPIERDRECATVSQGRTSPSR